MRKDVTVTNQERSDSPWARRAGFFSPWVNDLWDSGRWYDNFLSPDLSVFPTDSRFFSPAIDIDETTSEYMVSADLPGIKLEDIQVDCSGNQLTITAERKYEKNDERKNGRSERFFGTYQRSFTLPIGVDTNKIDASYESGVLTVHVPKGESIKSKKIQISAKSAGKENKH